MSIRKANNAARKRDVRERNRKAGLCNCGKPRTDHRKTCLSCRQARDRSIQKNRDKGLCLCGRKPLEGKKYCERCLLWFQKRNARNRALGLCKCGRPLKNFWGSKCEKCFAYNKKYREQKISEPVKLLYREPTKDERRKYAGLTKKQVLKRYYDYLY